jgi:hypothetical protein
MLLGMAVTVVAVATLAAVAGGWAVEANQFGRGTAIALLAVFGLATSSWASSRRAIGLPCVVRMRWRASRLGFAGAAPEQKAQPALRRLLPKSAWTRYMVAYIAMSLTLRQAFRVRASKWAPFGRGRETSCGGNCE